MANLTLGNSSSVQGELYWDGTEMVLNSTNLTVTPLSGAGNGYLCVDSNGRLYRSGAACV